MTILYIILAVFVLVGMLTLLFGYVKLAEQDRMIDVLFEELHKNSYEKISEEQKEDSQNQSGF